MPIACITRYICKSHSFTQACISAEKLKNTQCEIFITILLNLMQCKLTSQCCNRSSASARVAVCIVTSQMREHVESFSRIFIKFLHGPAGCIFTLLQVRKTHRLYIGYIVALSSFVLIAHNNSSESDCFGQTSFNYEMKSINAIFYSKCDCSDSAIYFARALQS